VTRFFDAAAVGWDERIRARSPEYLEQHLAPLMTAAGLLSRPPSRVLEVGTGTGMGALWLAQRFPEAEVLGIDISARMIQGAEAKAGSVDLGRITFGQQSSFPLRANALRAQRSRGVTVLSKQPSSSSRPEPSPPVRAAVARPRPSPHLYPTSEEKDVLLANKTAIIYGAAGAIGSAVARAYAREGAEVHLAGRTEASLAQGAERIQRDGGAAHVARLDVLDEAAVQQHADAVAARRGIDICFNATSNDDVQGTALADMPFDDFMRPVTKSATAQFIIANAVARHMAARGRGVILVMAGGREAIPHLGGSHVAWAALAGLCRQLAAELGPAGIRVAWLLSPGSAGSDDHSGAPGASDAAGLLLARRPSYDDVANVAVFAASDWAGTMTATELNFTAGAVID